MKEDAVFYVGQKAFIKKGSEILILTDPSEGLDFPGGKIQEGEENLEESLRREVREETGLEIKVGEPFTTSISVFRPNHRFAGKKVILIAYKCEYVSGDVKLSPEHSDYTWVTKDNYSKADDRTSFFDMLEKYFS